MQPKALARGCAIAGLGAVAALAAPASSHPSAPAGGLPQCTPRAASTRAPTGPARLDDPSACRVAAGPVLEASGPARSSGPDRASARTESEATAGYRHLGAGTAGEWAGVSGRLTVTDPAVRAGSYDFLAARFMVKQRLGSGDVAWLEAGWAETGWSGGGRQRIYTYDTNGRVWRFYDEFVLRPGDRVWLDVHAGADGRWQAWLWWDDRWNLLAAESLPIGADALIEQYVELHVDAERPARIAVPPVAVERVHLLPTGGGRAVPWREHVGTVTDEASEVDRAALCLDWVTRYDTWSAGDCPPSGGRRTAEPADASGGDAPAGRPGTSDRPGGPQPDGERPADEEPATVVGDPTPAEDTTDRPPLLPLLTRR